MKRRLILVGDACCESGFARATHHIAEHLVPDWELHIIAINYHGDSHPFRTFIESHGGKVYPAFQPGGGLFGVRRVGELCIKLNPDVVLIQNDPWNIKAYTDQIQAVREMTEGKVDPVVIGALAVDGKNLRAEEYLSGLNHAIFWTEFARKEAIAGGWKKTADVIPLGVDRVIYCPGDRLEARRRLGWDALVHIDDDGSKHPIPEDGFVFLNVNRNQPRKRLDLTFWAFADLVKEYKADAYLYLHICPTGDNGWDLPQLTRYFGLRGRVILVQPNVSFGSKETELADTYRAANCLVSTTQGEGMGLTTLEAMACEIPCIVPNWSALGDWAHGALLVDCDQLSVTPNGVCNVVGSVPNHEAFVNAMREVYTDKLVCSEVGKRGFANAAESRFDWEVVGRSFADSIAVAYDKARLGL